MINKVENLFNLLKNYIDNTNERSSKIIKTEKNNFKKFHNGLKKNHLMNISNSQYSIKSGVIYSDILSGMENVTSHIIEVKKILLINSFQFEQSGFAYLMISNYRFYFLNHK